MDTEQVASALLEIADRLVAGGEQNRFRINSYKRAAGILKGTKTDLSRATMESLTDVGIGEKLAGKILTFRDEGTHPQLAELRATTTVAVRAPRAKVEKIVRPVVRALVRRFGKANVEVCGSYRRGRADLKDVDVVVATDGDPADACALLHRFGEPVDKGTKATAIVRQGIQIDLRVVPTASFGAALLFFTGSGAFNIRCRGAAKAAGLVLNRYGLYRRNENGKPGEVIAQRQECDILDALGLGWIPPEARE